MARNDRKDAAEMIGRVAARNDKKGTSGMTEQKVKVIITINYYA